MQQVVLFICILGLIRGSTGDFSSTGDFPQVTFIALPEDSKARGESYVRPLGGSKVFTEAYLPRDATTSCYEQQVHVSLGDSDDSVFISYVSSNQSANTVLFSQNKLSLQSGYQKNITTSKADSSVSYSQLLYIYDYLYAPEMGKPLETASYIVKLQNSSVWARSRINGTSQHWANYYMSTSSTPVLGITRYNNPYMYYDSQILHTATLTGLVAGKTYYYKPVDSCQLFSFKMPPKSDGTSKSYPMLVGLVVDLGQTAVSNASINALISMNPSVVLLAGDLAYADGFYALWDTFGNLFEPLASKIPVLSTGGNHEVGASEQWRSYSLRYPTPHKGSGSTNFCYYGKVVGVMHVIALCTYAGFSNTSLQYNWLENYLATKVNRTQTPWLVTIMHAPWYSSNTGHWMEAELMRRSLEPILYKYGVDIVLCGHVHSYERTLPVYNNSLNQCGPVHLTIGDGGNYEGTYVPWRTPKPVWSAFRESSFGVAGLDFLNRTTAKYSWHRHACQGGNYSINFAMNFSDACVTPGDNGGYSMQTSDVAFIVKPPRSLCPNRWISTATVQTPSTVSYPSAAPSSCSSSSSDNTYYNAVVGLSVACALLGFTSVMFAMMWWVARSTSKSMTSQESQA
mmetsp:Transcript_24268/g.33296  ORF Transcript_24268/g.33296 Transcript_24268/m.33296 type:complete len:626 (-) Transcript_24268:167-2044(-)